MLSSSPPWVTNYLGALFHFLYVHPVCQNGDIRLQGGSNASEGRVEVCNENRWGTVCDDGWSTQDAQVACNQLGFAGQGNRNRPLIYRAISSCQITNYPTSYSDFIT